jgi:DNA-binding response OmpR family regulator
MVTASIKTLGAEIDVLDVPSAEEALFISASLPLDLVVLDIRLPGMTGLEMVTRLRKRTPEIKIILVTGVEDASTRKQVAESGVAAYFFKPIDIEAFLGAVRRALWTDQDSLPEAIEKPALKEEPAPNAAPVVSIEPGVKVSKPVSSLGFQPTLEERLTALKQQVRASSVLLVDEVGKIMAMAGDPSSLTSSKSLLPALMDSFRASYRVSDALSKSSAESLLCFMLVGQRIYLAPIDPSHLLLVDTSGYFEPDKIGLLDRAIHSAVVDLRDMLEHSLEEKKLQPPVDENKENELPEEVTIDQETSAGVADMFSQAPQAGGKEQADGFWEMLEKSGALDGTSREDVLSYDQAHRMGLTPEEGDQP